MTKQIVLASNNAGKLKELNALFTPFNIEVINQGQLNVADAVEDGLSFIENAIIKARHACLATGLASIADDSGLEVQALAGQPGIYSARFDGNNATDDANNIKLLKMIESIPAEQRQARFKCTMVYMRHANDPSPIMAEGELQGIITEHSSGNNGFGYDPIFYLPQQRKTCAELKPTQKNAISHRAKATEKLIKKLIANKLLNP